MDKRLIDAIELKQEIKNVFDFCIFAGDERFEKLVNGIEDFVLAIIDNSPTVEKENNND